MTTPLTGRTTPTGRDDDRDLQPARLRGEETKPAWKTTELLVYVVAVIGVLIASRVAGDDDGSGDYFAADKAWLYVTLLSVGYMLARGLAKAGARSNDADPRTR